MSSFRRCFVELSDCGCLFLFTFVFYVLCRCLNKVNYDYILIKYIITTYSRAFHRIVVLSLRLHTLSRSKVNITLLIPFDHYHLIILKRGSSLSLFRYISHTLRTVN